MDRQMFNAMDNGVCTTAMDLSNLVTWAHTHGSICNQIPILENVQLARSRPWDNAVLWLCAAGHAYNWPCQRSLRGRLEEKEDTVEPQKCPTDYDVWQGGQASLGGECRLVSEDPQNTRPASKPTAGQELEDTVYVMCDAASLKGQPYGLPTHQEGCDLGPDSICSTPDLHCLEQPRYHKACIEEQGVEHQEVIEEMTDEDLFEVEDEGQRLQATGNGTVGSWGKEEDFQEPEVRQGGIVTIGTPSSAVIHLQSPLPPALLEEPSGESAAKTDSGCIDPDRTSLNSDSQGASSPQSKTVPTASSPQASTAAGKPSARSRKRLRSFSARKLNKCFVAGMSETGSEGLEVACHVPYFDTSSDTLPEPMELNPEEAGILEDINVGTPDQVKRPPRAYSSIGTFGSCTSESEITEKSPMQASHKKHPKNIENKKVRNIADIKIFRDWLAINYPTENREVHAVPPSELDSYMTSFYTKVRKVSGLEFSASSLLFFQTSIERYLREHSYEYSIARGAEFTASQEALRFKVQNLLQQEKARDWGIVQSLMDKDVESLRKKGVLSRMNPDGLLNLMFINNIRAFGVRRQFHSTTLRWGRIVLKKAPDGSECLEWKESDTEDTDPEDPTPCVYSRPNDPENCPVLDYQEYAKRRPPDMMHEADPFYLSPKPLYCLWDQTWYCRKSLAKCKMDKIMKIVIHQAKVSDRKSK